jgi:hydroxymethylbilane synthase
MVEQALLTRRPDLLIERITRSSLGDRDRRVELWQSPDKGLFTTDLSEALVSGEADIVVHSWKDLPVAGFPGTVVAGTLERADPRDVLLVRRDALTGRPSTLDVLTSSPRRTWQMQQSLAGLLPWPVDAIVPKAVRGNIPTRLERLADGPEHALVVAKAALDRLLSPEAGADVSEGVRAALDRHVWMVLPISEFPTAPAQGALALEVATNRSELRDLADLISDEPTRRAVEAERAILSAHGGGCHEAIGASVLVRDYGVITSVRGRAASGEEFSRWSLDATTPVPPRAGDGVIWPRPTERDGATRRALDVAIPADDRGWWVARADAVPAGTTTDGTRIVWAAGTRTWRRLAARGIWVHGCSDGLGDMEAPGIDGLAGRSVQWHRLTHTGSRGTDALATYEVDTPLPQDLASRTHFFWTSGTVFLDALERYPAIRQAWHGCGPGRTAQTVIEALGDRSRVSIWLDYEQWHRHVNPH